MEKPLTEEELPEFYAKATKHFQADESADKGLCRDESFGPGL
jgi:hypothetical protein